jgi:hypothetical protein
VTVTLDEGSYGGQNADWWVVADTPFGWYYYNLSSDWLPGLLVTHQGPLFNLNPYQVLNRSTLPEGTYTFYFGVDEVMNGVIDGSALYFDRVDVTIASLGDGFSEDFDDGVADNWIDDGSGVWSISGGAYVMTGSQPVSYIERYSYYNQIYSDFTYQVDVRRTAGSLADSHGMLFRSDGTLDNAYTFHVDANGSYLIYKKVDGVSTWLTNGWTASPYLNRGYGAWNTLKVAASGSNLSFYANGSLLDSFIDSSLSSGVVGVKANDPEYAADVKHFDNAILMESTAVSLTGRKSFLDAVTQEYYE